MRLASFDIFDTALIRKCGAPENIFYLLAHRLYPEDRALRDDFLVWRRHVAQRLAASHSGGEVTLADIYADADFSGYTREELYAAELEVEANNLVANPQVREIINRHRATGDTICFISDMYLPSAFLKKILARELCLDGDEKIFVSCEWNARKNRGTLYKLVKSELCPRTWIHYGDNRHSDIRMAQRNGLHAKQISTAYTSQESAQLRTAELCRHPQELKLLIGVSRYARLVSGNRPETVLAANVLAPAYVPYVLWVLTCAKKEGIQRLHFLSRDGWILRHIAQSLDSRVDCTDLFISRKALILPWLTLDFQREALLSVEDYHTLIGRKTEDILGHLKLTIHDCQKNGITFAYDRIITAAQQKDFLDKIFHSEFTEFLKKRAEGAYSRLLGYLKQTLLTDKKSSALVDVGWIGTSRKMLNDILRHEWNMELPTYYYSVRHDVFSCQYGRYESYFPEGTLSSELTEIIENYLSASPYPTTLDYKYVNGQWQPEWIGEETTFWNSVIRANESISYIIAQTIKDCPACNHETLMLWAKNANDEMLTLSTSVRLEPLAKINDFDGVDFVRKMTAWEMFRRIFLGERITAWDKASLTLSCGYSAKNLLWPLCELSGKLRSALYKRMLRKKLL